MRIEMTLGMVRLRLLLDTPLTLNCKSILHPATAADWGPGVHPDAEGNVPANVCALLISEGEEHTLVDTGFGELDPDGTPRAAHAVVEGLAQLGIAPEQLRHVIITHAHYDHCLGNTRREGGQRRPVFPAAEYILQARELAALREAEGPMLQTRFAPLEAHGQLRLVDGPAGITPAVSCRPTPGHTAGHQSVLIRSGDAQTLYLGDLAIVARSMERPEWGPDWAWSREADERSRREVAEWAVDSGAVLILGHDPEMPWIRLTRTPEGYQARAAS